MSDKKLTIELYNFDVRTIRSNEYRTLFPPHTEMRLKEACEKALAAESEPGDAE